MRGFLFFLCLSGLLLACQNSAPASEQGAETGVTTANQPPQNPNQELRIVLGDQTVQNGQQVCVEVEVHQFQQIMSMQYTLHWDPAVLRFDEVKGMNLKDLSANNFGTNAADQGRLTFSWFDQDLKSISLPDGSKIYQVCFTAVGQSGSQSPLYIDGNPVVIEISNAAGEVIGFAARRARVSIP